MQCCAVRLRQKPLHSGTENKQENWAAINIHSESFTFPGPSPFRHNTHTHIRVSHLGDTGVHMLHKHCESYTVYNGSIEGLTPSTLFT